MADEEDVADIMEQGNVVVVDDGTSRGLQTTVVVTREDGMMVARVEDPSEPSLDPQGPVEEEEEEEEEVGGILEQAMASHNLIEYAEQQSPADNNKNAATQNVVSVVGPSGNIVNTVVDTTILSQNNDINTDNTNEATVTTDPHIIHNNIDNMIDTSGSRNDAEAVDDDDDDNNNDDDDDMSSLLSIPNVVHLEQTTPDQQPELPNISTQDHQQQQHGIGPTTVVLVAADPGTGAPQHVGDQEPSPPLSSTTAPLPQPVSIETHRYVDGAGNFTVVAPPNSSSSSSPCSSCLSSTHASQQSSLSHVIVSSANGIIKSGGSVPDDVAGRIVQHPSLSRHQNLLGQHAGLTATHVLSSTSSGVTQTTLTDSNGNENTNVDDEGVDPNRDPNEVLMNPPMHITLHRQQDVDDEGLDREMDPDGVENGQNEEGVDSDMDTDHQSSNGLPPGSISITLAPSNDESGAPLGSSQNPIRIIQQGNQYTPLQQLTTDQLQQIMQVVQQQQLARSNQAERSSILFNPQTNTRIVYRVIYPSELQKSAEGGANSEAGSDGGLSSSQAQVETQSQGQQTITFSQLPRRAYRRRNRDEEEKIDGPELTKEEKEERKKKRPRTRSGRVSKPPKHMVKDYKHIHVLDWDEDYDDSDGGYSDIKYAEDEEAVRRAAAAAQGNLEAINEPYIHPGLGSSKPKNFKCETCSKAYIGRAGLARHYRLNPDHGQLSAEDELELRNQVLHQTATNGLNISGNLSEDSNTQDSILGLSSVPKSATLTTSPPVITFSNNIRDNNVNPAPSLVTIGTTTPMTSSTMTSSTSNNSSSTTTSNNVNHVVRGRRLGHLNEPPAKRKARLKELIKQCEDEELMEIVLPRLATVITVWEFLLMKVEKGCPSRPHMADVYKEFEMLHKQVQKMCQTYLTLLPEGEENLLEGNSTNKFQIQNPTIAQALGLSTGMYDVKELPAHEENNTFQYKLLTTEPSTLSETSCQTSGKRTVELVTQDQLVSQPLNKRVRLVTLNTNDGMAGLNQFPTNSVVTLPSSTTHPQQQQLSHTRSIVDCANNQSQLTAPQVQRTPLTETINIRPVVAASNSGCAMNIPTKNNGKMVLSSANSSAPIRTIVHFTNNMIARNGANVMQLSGTADGNGSISSVAAVATSSACTGAATSTTATTTVPIVNGVANAANGTTVMLPIRVVSTAPPSSQQSSTELVPPLPPPTPPLPPLAPSQQQPQTPITILPHMTTTTMNPKITSSIDEALVTSDQTSESPGPSLLSGVDRVDMVDAAATATAIASPLHQQTPQTVSLLPVSVTQTPSPQTSMVAAEQSSSTTTPLAELAQIQQHSGSASSLQLQPETDQVPDETESSADGGMEHTVMEVPLSMEPTSQPITVAVSTANVLDLGHLNSEDNELKGRVLGSIDQSPIIFQDSVAGQIVTPDQLLSGSNIFQTADGIIIIQKPDGTTMQFQGEQSISLETVQALLAMDTEGQLEQVTPVPQQQQTTDNMGEQ